MTYMKGEIVKARLLRWDRQLLKDSRGKALRQKDKIYTEKKEVEDCNSKHLSQGAIKTDSSI